jgi:hypothetical protein
LKIVLLDRLKDANDQQEQYYTNIDAVAKYLIKGILQNKYSPFKICDDYIAELLAFSNNFEDQFCTQNKTADPVFRLQVDPARIRICLKHYVETYNTQDSQSDDWDEVQSFEEYVGGTPCSSIKDFADTCYGRTYTLDELVNGLMTTKDDCLNALNSMLCYMSLNLDGIARGFDDEDQEQVVPRIINQVDSEYQAFEGINRLVSKTLGKYVESGEYRQSKDLNPNESQRLLNVAAFGLSIANMASLEHAKRIHPKRELMDNDPINFEASLKSILAPKSSDVSSIISKSDTFKGNSMYNRSLTNTAFGECMSGANNMAKGYAKILKHKNPGSVKLSHFSEYKTVEPTLARSLRMLNNPYSDQSAEQEVAAILANDFGNNNSVTRRTLTSNLSPGRKKGRKSTGSTVPTIGKTPRKKRKRKQIPTEPEEVEEVDVNEDDLLKSLVSNGNGAVEEIDEVEVEESVFDEHEGKEENLTQEQLLPLELSSDDSSEEEDSESESESESEVSKDMAGQSNQHLGDEFDQTSDYSGHRV